MSSVMDDNELDSVYQKDRDLVIGFIKSVHHTYNKPDICRLITLYYHTRYTFDRNFYGKQLSFSINSVKHAGNCNGNWSNCIFGPSLNDRTCHQFDIQIAWKHKGGAFVMGFITQSIEQSIKSWNTHHLGFGANRLHSIGIRVNERYNNLYLYDAGHSGKKLKYHTPTLYGFQPNDLFLLSFNFKSYTLTIYHNGCKADTLCLNDYKYMSLTPAFSLKWPRSQIDVIKCSMS